MEKYVENRFRKIYSQDVKLPERLHSVTILSCLAYGERQQVYLAKDARRRPCILKTAQGEKLTLLRKDAAVLKEQTFSFLPEFYDYTEEDGHGYLLREYIRGDTLWELVNQKGTFSLREAGEIICRLCDMLSQLHAQRPPMIHRDIKPQNIVITPEKNIFLIDLGTAREYKYHKNANWDTMFVGSKPSAAPEQYGYRQTDARTDIYALGILYLFLLTGDMNVQETRNKEQIPSCIWRIISKCTKMDPEDRYQNGRELKRAIKTLSGKRIFLKSRKKKLALVCGGIAAFAAALLLFRYWRGCGKRAKRRNGSVSWMQ